MMTALTNSMHDDGFIKIENLPSADTEDTESPAKLRQEAKNFLRWHHWCGPIEQGYLVYRWAGILSLFYFEIKRASPETENKIWVIVGDVPPASMSMEICPTAIAAIDGYVYELERWVDAVKREQPVEELMPVYSRISLQPVEPTLEIAQDLERRLSFILTRLLPYMPYRPLRQL